MPSIIHRDHLAKEALKEDGSRLPSVPHLHKLEAADHLACPSPTQGAPWLVRYQKQKARSRGTERENLQTEVYPAHPNEEIMPMNSKITPNLVHSVRCTPAIRRLLRDIVPTTHRNIPGYRGCCLLCKSLFESCD